MGQLEVATAARQAAPTTETPLLELNLPKIDRTAYQSGKEITAFAASLGEVEKTVKAVLDDKDVPLAARVSAAADASSAGILAAAKKAGLGKFADISELSAHLKDKHQIIVAPLMRSHGDSISLNIELVKGTKVDLDPAQVKTMLGEFTKATGIEPPKVASVFVQERMLFDSAPKIGISANYGSAVALPGKPFSIILDTAKIAALAADTKTSIPRKEQTVLANELVAAAYAE